MWRAPLPDYDLKGWDQMGLGMQSLGYIFSAVVGMAIIVAVIMSSGQNSDKREIILIPDRCAQE